MGAKSVATTVPVLNQILIALDEKNSTIKSAEQNTRPQTSQDPVKFCFGEPVDGNTVRLSVLGCALVYVIDRVV